MFSRLHGYLQDANELSVGAAHGTSALTGGEEGFVSSFIVNIELKEPLTSSSPS